VYRSFKRPMLKLMSVAAASERYHCFQDHDVCQMRWRLREACRLVVDHPRAAHLSSTPSGSLPHLQSLCSRAEISSSIQPVGARTHDTAALASVSGCDSTSACRLRTEAPSWRSTIRRRPCEKANIGEQLPLATRLRSLSWIEPAHMRCLKGQ